MHNFQNQTNMKKLFILLTALISCITVISAKDVLYLKNGSIIKGEMTEVVPNGKVKFKTADGNIFAYDSADVIKITKEKDSDSNSRDIINLENGSIIKGSLMEFVINGNAVLKTNDGSTFIYSSEEIQKISKDTSVTAPSSTTSYNNVNANNRQQELRTSVNNRHLAKRGYRGFVDLGLGYYVSGVAAFEISTTHGYQLNHNFFVGAGIGVDVLFPDGDFLDSSGVAIPIFAAFKGNVGSGIVQFTYGSRLGLSVVEDYIPFLWNVNAGLRFGFTPNFALQITPDFSLLAGSNFFDIRAGLRIGIEF